MFEEVLLSNTVEEEPLLPKAFCIIEHISGQLEKGENVICDAPIEAMDIFVDAILKNSELCKDSSIIEAIMKLMSSSTFNIEPYVNNEPFIISIIQSLPDNSLPIGKIIEFCIKSNKFIIPWLISNESNFLQFPENDSYLDIYNKIQSIIVTTGGELDTSLINKKAVTTIIKCAELTPLNTLNALKYLIKAKYIEFNKNILDTIHSLIEIVASDEAFSVLVFLGVRVEDNIDFTTSCLTKYETFLPCLRYIKQMNPSSLSKEIIGLLVHLFDSVPYRAKIDIFTIIEPYIPIIKDPQIIKITSFFIDDTPFGSLALKYLCIAFTNMPPHYFEQCYDILCDKTEELEALEMSNSIDSYFASLLLDVINK